MPDLYSKKNKHVILDDRLEIQECLNHGMTFKAIATRIGKDQTTVSKEVKTPHYLVQDRRFQKGHCGAKGYCHFSRLNLDFSIRLEGLTPKALRNSLEKYKGSVNPTEYAI